MGFRTTGVRLVANVRQFVSEMSKSQRATKDFTKNLDEARIKGARMANQLANVSKASNAELARMVQNIEKLDKQIESTERTIMRFARSYSSTGNDSFLKQISNEQRRLSTMQQIRNLLPDPRIQDAAGKSLAERISEAFGRQWEVRLGVAAAPAILAMTPFIGATIAGAVVGGIGVGGVVGGVALAARDPRVKDAGAELGAFLLDDLTQKAQRFVDPVLRGIQRIRQGWGEMAPDLNRIFTASRFVEPLTDGVIKMTQELARGIAAAIDKADQPVNAMRNLMAQLGTSFGDFFADMAQHANIGGIALNELAVSLGNVVEATSIFMGNAARVYKFFQGADTWIDRARYWVEDNNNFNEGLRVFGKNIDLTADGFKHGSVQAEAYRRATLGTATATDFATLKQAGMTDAQIAAADASGKYAAQLDHVNEATAESAVRSANLAEAKKALTTAQQELNVQQQAFQGFLANLNPKLAEGKMRMDALRTATQNLFGAQISGIESNEAYEASWDALSKSVKDNGNSLEITEEKGRSNRDALQALLQANNEVFFANVQLGMSLDDAREKHVLSTNKIIEHANKLGLDRRETQKLTAAYGAIPEQRITDLIVSGLSDIRDAMTRVYIAQRALAEGKSVNAVRYEGSAAMRTVFADGGYTGPGTKYQPAGVVHAGEYVIRKESTAKIQATNPGLLDELNATGQVEGSHTHGYADGGLAFPVEKRRTMPFKVNLRKSFVMSMEDALAKVVPNFGAWPSSPAAQRGDSGVWKRIVQLIRSSGINQGSFGNAYRPGDPKWHGSGRAVDWMGYNMDALASFLAAKRPLELIHRTNRRDYAYTRGRNMGSFNNALMEAHRNHIHIAMNRGGIIREPVLGYGASGATYSFAENGPERVLSASATAAGGGTVTISAPIHINGSNLNPQQIATAVGRELGYLVDQYSRGV